MKKVVSIILNSLLVLLLAISIVPKTPVMAEPEDAVEPTPVQIYPFKGNVFMDTNYNGVKDEGETGAKNQKVTISRSYESFEYTDTSGNYEFEDTTAGTYTITLHLPNGYIATTTNPKNISVTGDTTLNFGMAHERPEDIVLDYDVRVKVFLDANQNGVFDFGEVNVSNVGVSYIGPESGSILTDGSGIYLLRDILKGEYNFSVAVPDGYTSTTANPMHVEISGYTYLDFGIVETAKVTPTVTPTPIEEPLEDLIVGSEGYYCFETFWVLAITDIDSVENAPAYVTVQWGDISEELPLTDFVDGFAFYATDKHLETYPTNINFSIYEGWNGETGIVYGPCLADPITPTPTVTPTPEPTDGYKAEYFSNKNLTGEPVKVRYEETIDHNWDGGTPDISVPIDNFSARWTKTDTFEAGIFEFSIAGDDGVRVFVDNELIVDGWKDQGTTAYKGTKALTAGSHTVRVEYYENTGGAVVKFDYRKLPNTPPPTSGYAAEYFANRTLSGAPALTRTDAAINFEWNDGSPASGIPADNFSARWTKTENFAAGTHEFTTTSDDGVRLYVDGELLIDKWIDQGSTTYKATKALSAGNHIIVVEYYEKGGGAVMKFDYAQTNVVPPPGAGFTGEYFNNKNLSAPVAMTRSDDAIDFDWAGGSPDPLINADNFSVRWTKTEVFENGTYEFTVTADDGIRVKVDGEVLIDKFIDQGATTYKATKALIAGNHTVVIEYYEAGGGAMVKANYAKVGEVTPPPTEKYQAKYWNLPTAISQPTIPTTAPTLTREEDTIDHTWNDDAPAAGINANGYVAQWVKTQTFEAGTYKFTTESDDGIRVYIDNESVIDQWNDHGSTTHTGQKELTAGDHVIRVEYYENGGGAVAKFNFEKVTNPDPEPVPTDGFNIEFFNTIDLTGAPVLTKLYSAINFIMDGGSPDPVVNNNNFSARATKTKDYAAGTYNFTIKSDDGVKFWIDDQLIVDDWNDHAMTTHNPSVTLTQGTHTLKLEYYEKDGGAVFIFEEN